MRDLTSRYGWIVVATLVISVIIAFATPFGTFIGNVVVQMMNAAGTGLNNITEEGVNQSNEYYNELFASQQYLEPGLYSINNNTQALSSDWAKLCSEKTISVKDGNNVKSIYTQYDATTNTNASSPILDGHLILKSDVVYIPSKAFAECDELDCITIRDVDVVDTNAFYNCDKLTTIIIERQTMEGFKENAITNCPNFNTIIFKGTYKQFKTINFEKQAGLEKVTLVCNDRTVMLTFK